MAKKSASKGVDVYLMIGSVLIAALAVWGIYLAESSSERMYGAVIFMFAALFFEINRRSYLKHK